MNELTRELNTKEAIENIAQICGLGIKEVKELQLKLREIIQKLKNELISTIRNLTVHNKIQLRFD